MEREAIQKALGLRLREIRTAKGLSQAKLAANIGKDQQYIQRIEVGNSNPTFYHLYVIAEGLGMDVGQMLQGIIVK